MVDLNKFVLLQGTARAAAIEMIKRHHYTHTVPSGKSYYLQYEAAIIVWSIPANKNIAKFILGWPGSVWELSRLWAPDGHRRNLLSEAISGATRILIKLERPDAVVSYADPNANHTGGVYRAASWEYHGQSEEARMYIDGDGQTLARRAFHSGSKSMTKAEIEACGYKELRLPGKLRFIRRLSREAKRNG